MRHGKPGGAPGRSNRQLRVGENVRHALAEVLQRETIEDAALRGVFVTVPEVRMSPDLKLATVYVLPLGGGDAEAVAAALERHKRFLRGEVARRVDMKFAPDLRFRADESFAEGEKIDRLLDSPQVARDTRRRGGDAS
jgi:ribosome-binding factor A